MSDSPVLLIASSPTEKKLMPLSVQQVERVLDMLSDVETAKEALGGILNESALQEARTTLQDIQILVGPVVNLTEKLSVVLAWNAASTSQWKLQVVISDISMIPMSLEFVGFEGSNDNIKVSFNIEGIPQDDIRLLRLLDDVLLYIDLGNGKELEYTGVCIKLAVHDDLLVMIIKSSAHHLSNSRIAHLSVVGFNPFDLIHLIVRNGGFKEKQLNIEGYLPDNKAYTVTVPILNMILTEPLGLGNVMFNPTRHSLEEVARIHDVAKESSTVFETNSLAVVYVESNSLYDAFKIGIKQIEQALDVVLHIIRADTVFKGVAADLIFGSWELDELIPNPVVSTWVYVEEPFGGGRIIMDTSRIEQPDMLTISANTHNVLEQMEWYESLIRDLDETGDEALKSLFSALKWLRRSWDAKDAEDKIIFANIALEFVASGEPSPPVIPKELTKIVRKAAVNKFEELFNGEGKEEFVTKLNQKLGDSLNNAPLRTLIEGIIERHHNPITDADMKLIFEGRKIRNDLVHGRGTDQTFTLTQNRKMVNAIGILASHKLKSFYKEDSQ